MDFYDTTHAIDVVRKQKDGKCYTLSAHMGTGGNNVPVVHYCLQGSMINRKVRRLTPMECERLQGLPDGYTDIEFQGKPPSDAKRYKAIGNGMSQPCADFIMRQIAIYADAQQEGRESKN